MDKFRQRWVYAPITATLLVAVICRKIYEWQNPQEFKQDPDKSRLDWRFPVTQIPYISTLPLFWSTLMTYIFWFTQCRNGRCLEYATTVLSRMSLSMAVWLFLYIISHHVLESDHGGFDPSGHYSVNIMVQAHHASYYSFVAKHAKIENLTEV